MRDIPMCTRPAKRVALVHDLSGLGRCALGIAMPVLSVMGIQACALPTMVLSSHTGGFEKVAKLELTDFLHQALSHWRSLDASFDAVYAGYIPAEVQLPLIQEFIASQSGAFVLIDPVMADHGKLYSGFTESRPRSMRALCARADLITPNLTEAFLLLGDDPRSAESPLSSAQLDALLCGLLSLGCRAALITGVRLDDGRHANAYRAAREKGTVLVPYYPEPGAYPGTGDLFAAVVLGAILNARPIGDAIAVATDFVKLAVQRTNWLETPPREGVQFESLLHHL